MGLVEDPMGGYVIVVWNDGGHPFVVTVTNPLSVRPDDFREDYCKKKYFVEVVDSPTVFYDRAARRGALKKKTSTPCSPALRAVHLYLGRPA